MRALPPFFICFVAPHSVERREVEIQQQVLVKRFSPVRALAGRNTYNLTMKTHNLLRQALCIEESKNAVVTEARVTGDVRAPLPGYDCLAARWQRVFCVGTLMLALNDHRQLFVVLCGWADNFFWLDNLVDAGQSKTIDGFIIDHVTNPDLTDAIAESFPDVSINLHV